MAISNKKTRFSALNKFYIIRKNKTKFSNYDLIHNFCYRRQFLLLVQGAENPSHTSGRCVHFRIAQERRREISNWRTCAVSEKCAISNLALLATWDSYLTKHDVLEAVSFRNIIKS
jgi:hypothetical protein